MRDKTAIREGVWNALVQSGAARSRRVHDRIPDFHGSQEAAERVFGLRVWQEARVVKSNPDLPPASPAAEGAGGRQGCVHGSAAPAGGKMLRGA